MDIAPLCEVRCRLAEGPLWDEREQALYWVDAEAALLYRYDHESAGVREWMLPSPNVGSLDEGRRQRAHRQAADGRG